MTTGVTYTTRYGGGHNRVPPRVSLRHSHDGVLTSLPPRQLGPDSFLGPLRPRNPPCGLPVPDTPETEYPGTQGLQLGSGLLSRSEFGSRSFVRPVCGTFLSVRPPVCHVRAVTVYTLSLSSPVVPVSVLVKEDPVGSGGEVEPSQRTLKSLLERILTIPPKNVHCPHPPRGFGTRNVCHPRNIYGRLIDSIFLDTCTTRP